MFSPTLSEEARLSVAVPPGVHALALALPLFAAGCGQMRGARALPSLPPGVTVSAEEVSYAVRGTTVEEIGRSLHEGAAEALQPRRAGEHRWNVRWSYRFAERREGCEMTAVNVELSSTIMLPDWTDRERADSAVTAMWDEYITLLRDHEFTHRELSYRAARDISREVGRIRLPQCGGMRSEANLVARRILDRYDRQNAEFDEASRGTIRWPPQPPGGS